MHSAVGLRCASVLARSPVAARRRVNVACSSPRIIVPSLPLILTRRFDLVSARDDASHIRQYVPYRFFSNEVAATPDSDHSTSITADVPGAKVAAAGDLMIAMFTCKICETRTARTISKTSYTRGTVLVRCPGCKGLHLLADHLGFVDDNSVTAEELLAAKGEKVRKGAMGQAGDIDENTLNLTESDLAVLRSKTKALSAEGKEVEVVAAQGILGHGPTAKGEKGR